MRCKNCNFEYDKKAEFCPNCGLKKEKKDSKKIITISVLLTALIALLVVTIILVISNPKSNNNSQKGNDTSTLDKKTKSTKKKNEIGGYEYYEMDIDVDNLKIVYDGDLGQNIKVDKVIYDKNGLHVLLTNNNTIAVSPSVDLYFLDADGKRVDKGYGSSSNVAPGKKFATDVVSTSKKEFYDYELHVSAKKIKSYEHMMDIDSSSINVTETDNSLLIKYANNFDKEVNLYITVIYYKNNQVHFYDDLYIYVKPGTEESINSYYLYLPAGDLNTKDYDRYELVVSGAKYNDSTY
ncbi:MAG: zinc ribbon domain-containing protein [Bacilli bacterium]|nr:zinc ribbon domain-containing protein [Bacilli bacterium]